MKRKQIALFLGIAALSLCLLYSGHSFPPATALHAEISQEDANSAALHTESSQEISYHAVYDDGESVQASGSGQSTESVQASGSGQSTESVQASGSGQSAESVQENREMFAPYVPYGMTYDAVKDQLFYNGKLVRWFIDSYPVEDNEGNEDTCAVRAEHFCEGGTVDVYATRDLTNLPQNPDGSQDPSGILTGLKEFSQEEFDARDIEAIKNPPVTEATASEGGEATAADLQAMAEEYAPFGLTYDSQTHQWNYNGQTVKYCLDILTSNGAIPNGGNFHGCLRSFGSNGNSGGITIHTVRDYARPNAEGNGTLIGIEVDPTENNER